MRRGEATKASSIVQRGYTQEKRPLAAQKKIPHLNTRTMRARCLPAEYISQWEHFIPSSFVERFTSFGRETTSSSELRNTRCNSIRCSPHTCPYYLVLRHITVLSYNGQIELCIPTRMVVLSAFACLSFSRFSLFSKISYASEVRYGKRRKLLQQ